VCFLVCWHMNFLSVGSSRARRWTLDVAFLFCPLTCGPPSGPQGHRHRLTSSLGETGCNLSPSSILFSPRRSGAHFRARRPPTEGHGGAVLHDRGRRGPVRGPLSGGASRDRTRSPSYLCYFIHFSLFLSGSIHPTPVVLPPWASCSSSRSGGMRHFWL